MVGLYKDPLGGHQTLLSILPIDKIEPTPFQRDLSDAHHKRLADVINKTGRFLDPIIAVVAPGGGFWTPNGRASPRSDTPPWGEVHYRPSRPRTGGCVADLGSQHREST
jgi:hypothetical protein